ncbi:MAG: hypothetical protein ABJE66_31485 [Deltaproteobacteria bacterium]
MMPTKKEEPHTSVRPEGPGDDTAPVTPEPKSRTGAMTDVKARRSPPRPAPRPKRRR